MKIDKDYLFVTFLKLILLIIFIIIISDWENFKAGLAGCNPEF